MENPNRAPNSPVAFRWATGIEDTFIVHTRPGFRRLDEYELTQHYQLWKTDLDLVADTGLRALRWGIPWYRVQPEPNRWDWSWTDQVLDYMVNVKGIAPILDLVHYGTPGWLDNSFINASYPQRVAEYAAAVANRYHSLVHSYTPLNEPVLNASWSGRKGVWPPYLMGADGMVKVMMNIARGIVLTTKALRGELPGCEIVQVEANWKNLTNRPELEDLVALNNTRQYLSLDLTTGRVTGDHPLMSMLLENGVTESDLAWFASNAIEPDIIGVNFYPWSYGPVYRDGQGQLRRQSGRTHGSKIAEVLEEVHQRYQRPVMVTETSSLGGVDRRAAWMAETIAAVFSLRERGIPVVGYTWFPFFSMIKWTYRTGRRPLPDYVIHLGLYDVFYGKNDVLERTITPLAEQYRQYTLKKVPEMMQND